MIDVIIDILKSLLRIVVDLIDLLFSGVSWLLSARRNDTYGAIFGRPSSLVSRKGQGITLSGSKSTSLHRAFEHCLILGGSGTGKTSRLLANSLFKTLEIGKASVIAHDPSNELSKLTRAFAVEQGYDVRIIKYNSAQESCGYNPLARIRQGDRGDAARVANLLMTASKKGRTGGDPFWDSSAETFLQIGIELLMTQKLQFRNLSNLRVLIDHWGNDAMNKLVVPLYDQHRELYGAYKASLEMPERLRGNVLASARAALKLTEDSDLALVTSYDTVGLENLRQGDRPMILYIQSDILRQDYYSPITSLFMSDILRQLMGASPNPNDRPCFLYLDELSSFFYPWGPVISNARKYNVSFVGVVQSEAQIQKMHGREGATELLQNSGIKVYLHGQELETSERLERVVGKHEIEKDNKVMIRPLMSSQQIRRLNPNLALVIASGLDPILMPLRPWWKTRFKRYSQLEALPVSSTLPWSKVPLLAL